MVALTPIAARRAPGLRTCEHLAPLERELTAAGIVVGHGQPCPHDPEWGTWFEVDALFDVAGLRRRLPMDACVTYEEHEGVLSPSDATFYCTRCHRAIVGQHPRSSPPGTPRVS